MPSDPPDALPNVPPGAGDSTQVRDPDSPAPHDPPFPPGYKRFEEVGRGGMGVVYRARDIDLDRDVAVKLLLDKFPTGGETALRFVEESKIAARLQHPGIPPVYCIGTLLNGRPFMVMKLIKGPVRGEKPPTLADRLRDRPDPTHDRSRFLRVFEQICQAVGYAHERNVIHRDLKPSNVMVGAFGEVQVMDWGLGKVLPASCAADPGAGELTRIESPRDPSAPVSRGALGTPAFMAPEQALWETDRIGAPSDVFGLGAILCVILTGFPPYLGANSDVILGQAAAWKVQKALEGLEACGADAELIALAKQCLAKEPGDRMPNGRAVARAVAAWRVASEERARNAAIEEATRRAAEAARDHAKQLYLLALDGYNQMVFEIQAKLARRSGTLDLQKQVLSVAQSGLQQLVGEAEKHGTPDRTLLWTHSRMGDVHLALGDTSKARSDYEAGLMLAEKWLTADSNDAQAQRDLGIGFNKLGDVALKQGRADEARGFFERGLEVSGRLAAMDPGDAQALRDLSISLNKLGDMALQQGRVDEARVFFARGLEVSHRMADAEQSDAQAQRELSVSFIKLGRVSLHQGRADEARGFFERGLEVRERLAEADPSNHQAQRDLSLGLERLGDAALMQGRTDEARGFFERRLEVSRRLADADPSDAQGQRDLSISFNKLGDVALQQGRADEALGFFARGLEVSRRLADADPRNAQAQRDLIVSYFKLGEATQTENNFARAVDFYGQGFAVAQRFARPDFFANDISLLESRIKVCRDRLDGPAG